VFGIGSITKVFIATVILQLAEEARLNLSDNVSQHLEPETYANITNASDSTISQLLRHEAGIDSWEDDAEWIAHGRGKDLDPSHVWGKTEPLEYVRRPRKIAPPQGEWYYSNTNYTLLGLVIEAVTANTAEGEIRSRIIEPLGLGIYLEGFEAAHGDMPSRYHWVTDTFRSAAGLCPLFPLVRPDLMDASTSNLSVEWTAGGMLSSARDLVVFGKALRDGRLLKPASLKLMRQWRPTTTLGGEMGHGLFRIKFAGSGESEYWDGHFGGVLGFTAGLWWAEDGDVVVSVFSNVGTMHAGAVPGSGAHVIMNSGFLSAARELARCDDGDAFPA
jgi:D-alanyl-D-alanine carboxypeptidase